MFIKLSISKLLKLLDYYNFDEIHIHHTWKPEHKDFHNNYFELQESMKNYHMNTLGWSDIGQHVTLFPDGIFLTGRDFSRAPASIKGKNTGAFAVEMVGNFDIGHDTLEGKQLDSIIQLAQYFYDKGKYIRFHRENSSKTCPGSSISKEWFMNLVKKGNSMFKDVEKGKWYSDSIEKAAKYGLMMGRDKGFFFPEQPVTRAELATVAVRLFEKTNEDFVEVINQVLPAVVQIETPQGLGSGTIIHEDGYVLTNAHVVRDNEKVSFLSPDPVFDGSTYAEGPVIKVDKEKDLALCKIQLPAKFPTLKLTQYEPSQSEKVLVIGSPLGLIRSVSDGIVSGIRTMQNETYIQTDAEINPGNSGGALVNLRGELIGVPSWKLSSVEIEGLNFAIHHKEIRNFLKDTKLAL